MHETLETITRHRITLEGLAPYWAVPLAMLIIWGVWRLYWKELANIPAGSRYCIRVLRVLTLAVLILSFMNPTWEVILAETRKPLVAIAVDTSRSMDLPDPQMRPAELVRRAVALGELSRARRSTSAMQCAQALRAGKRTLLKAEAALAQAHARTRHAPMEEATLKEVASALETAEGIRKALLTQVQGVLILTQEVEMALSADAALLRKAEDARLGTERLARTVLEGFLPRLYEKARKYAGTRLDVYEIEESALETGDTAKLCRKLADEFDCMQDESDALLLAATDEARQKSIRALGALTRTEVAQRLLSGPEGLLAQLEPSYRVRLYGVNDRVELLGLDGSTQAAWETGGVGSDWGSGFSLLAESLANENLAGILMLSDGRHTEGPPPQETARAVQSLGVPMHAAGLGSTSEPVDLVLVSVQAPQTMYKEEALETRAFVRAKGFAGAKLTASLYDGETALGETSIVVPAGEASETVELQFRPCHLKAGRHRLEVRLAQVEGDAILENNRLAFQTTVMDRRPRALVIEGVPRWQHASLASALHADPNLELHEVILGTQPERTKEITSKLEIVLGKSRRLKRGLEAGEYPPSREDLFGYDVIFLGDFPILELSYEEQKDLADFVRDRGGSLVLCAGFRCNPYFYEDSALGELLPVVLPLEGSDDEHLAFRPYFQDGYALDLTPLGRNSPLCQFLPGMQRNLETWRDLPKSHWRFHGLAARSQSSVLVCTADENREPVIASQQVGLGRVLYIGLDDVWRWNTLDQSFSEVFWRNVLRWSMSGGNSMRGKHLAISTDRDRYGIGDQVTIGVQIADEDGIGLDNDMLTIAAYRAPEAGALPGKPFKKFRLDALAGSPGLYSASLDGLPEGRYVLRAYSALFKEEAERLTDLSFFVGRNPDLEFRDVSLNAPLLEELSQQCGGVYFSEDRLSEVVKHLPPGEVRESTRRTSRPLWDNWYYLLIVTSLFAAEWVIRKHSGLL